MQQSLSEGKAHKEAIRALKRRISDRIYRHLAADSKTALRDLVG